MTSSPFSEFIRNASPEEKAKVYAEVMDRACERQAHTCKRPSIANMDHKAGFHPDIANTVNRMCMTCGAHWYGKEGAVKEYTRAEWDAWVGSAFDGDVA